jgi:feruloyl esterase
MARRHTPLLPVLLWGAGVVMSPAWADEPACQMLAQSGLFAQTTVQSAVYKPADAALRLPAWCEVSGVISATPGSQVAVVYRLPDGWNGKFIGFGGGGWAGNTLLATAVPALAKGYATAQTNAGHDSRTAFDTSWAKGNPVAMTDFAHRAVHQMTVTGKQVVARHYGRPARRHYFQGCSTGGRMGMMESQRYPQDYDGIIAGAPVYSLLVQTSGLVRNRLFRAPGAAISAEQLKRVNRAAVAACDAGDGLEDGIVTDPRSCAWDPSALQCKAGENAASCLTPTQVATLRQAYSDIRNADGVVGNYGLTKGGEGGWSRFVQATPAGAPDASNGGLGELTVYMFGREDHDLSTFDPFRDQAAVHRTPFAREYEAASTNLSPFLKRGGKLLLWHGWDDPGPSALATIDYFERARKANQRSEGLQLYLAPGVYHCRGGPGADDFDMIEALDQWVESGKPPAFIPARNVQSGIERPLCPWPSLPAYKGTGDPKALSSFECRGPAAK